MRRRPQQDPTDEPRLFRRRLPLQIESLTAAVDLATLTAGGNDVGYLRDMTLIASAAWLERNAMSRPIGRLLRPGIHTR